MERLKHRYIITHFINYLQNFLLVDNENDLNIYKSANIFKMTKQSI